MTTADVRAKKVERIIELAYDSLKSHSGWTYKKTTEGKKFHKLAIKQYAEIIKLASELY